MDTQPNATDHTLGSKFKVQGLKSNDGEEGRGMFAVNTCSPDVAHTDKAWHRPLLILGQLLNEAIWIIDWLMDRLIGRLSSVCKHLQNALHAQTSTEQEHDSETS